MKQTLHFIVMHLQLSSDTNNCGVAIIFLYARPHPLPPQGLPTDTGANKGILLVAQRYSNDCKTTYTELSKIIRGVLASRRELVGYDQRIVEFGTGVVPEEGGPEQNNGTSGVCSVNEFSIPPIFVLKLTIHI